VPEQTPRDSKQDLFAPPTAAARARIVNRTHRIVREQALQMRDQRKRSRSLWVPVAICSALLLVVCCGTWAVLDSNDLNANGILDASDQMILFGVWMLPITLAVLGFLWIQRARSRFEGNGELHR
jgi:hypothetical protein